MLNRYRSTYVRALSGAAFLGLAAIPVQAFAQDSGPADDAGGLSEIIVTAQRRTENLRDVPISINAISGDALKAGGVSDTTALTQAVPSLNFTRSGPSGIFVIRGVATPNGAAGEEGSTAVYVDDVYMPDLSSTINKFNNIERIEVLNGPQGTLFGRNATGGLIRIITREPGDRTEFSGQVGFSTYETFSGQAYLATPLTENVGIDLAFTGQDQGRGYGFNPTMNKRVRTDDFWGLRSKLVARAGDNLKITLAGDYYSTNVDTALYIFPISVSAAGVATGPLAGQDTLAGFPSGTRIRVWGVSGKAELDLGFASLTSISSYRKLRNRSSFDIDGRAFDLLRLSYLSGSEAFQQEVRLASESTEPLSWQVGAFYLHAIAFQDQTQGGTAFNALNAIPGGSAPNTLHIVSRGVTDSVSVFGEATYAITPTTHLTGGVRWTSDHRKLPIGYTDRVNQFGVVFSHLTNPINSVTYSNVTFRAALRQELSDKISIYASVNKGFKSGQFNLQTPQDAPVRPQTVMAYEAGLKGEFLDNRLRVNIAGFHYDIDDYQIRATPSPTAASQLINAAKVKIDGVDVNAEAALSSRLRVTAGVAYLNARYAVFGGPNGGGVVAPVPGGNASGNRTALSPRFTFTGTANYTYPFANGSELRATVGYVHKSTYFFEADNLLRQKPYDLVNASLEYKVNDNIAFELWMKNIGNVQYNVQMVTAGVQSALAGTPREYGINAKFSF